MLERQREGIAAAKEAGALQGAGADRAGQGGRDAQARG
jgi:hypothetical protein